MSKERARRRAAREEQARALAAARQRRRARRERRQRLAARVRGRVVLPRRGRVARPRRGRVARPWNRRTRAQRLGIVLLVLVSQVVVWVFTASWPIRIVAALAAVLVTPALVTLSLDRSSR